MSSFRCSFCQHVNPAGAKFCNECGSVLRLKPCEHCDAINDGAALQCHQCGAEFSEASPLAAPFASAAVESGRASDSSVVRALETIGADLRSMQNPRSADDSASRQSVPLDVQWADSSDVGAMRPPIVVERAMETGLPSHSQPGHDDIRTRLGIALSRGEQPAESPRRGVLVALAVVTACGLAFFVYQQAVRNGPPIATPSSGHTAIAGETSATTSPGPTFNTGETSTPPSPGSTANAGAPSVILPDRPPATVQERPAATELEQPPATVQEQPATTMQEQPTVMQEQPTAAAQAQRATPQESTPTPAADAKPTEGPSSSTVPASGNGGASPATKVRAAGTRPLKAATARAKSVSPRETVSPDAARASAAAAAAAGRRCVARRRCAAVISGSGRSMYGERCITRTLLAAGCLRRPLARSGTSWQTLCIRFCQPRSLPTRPAVESGTRGATALQIVAGGPGDPDSVTVPARTLETPKRPAMRRLESLRMALIVPPCVLFRTTPPVADASRDRGYLAVAGSLHVVCPHCATTNRVGRDRLQRRRRRAVTASSRSFPGQPVRADHGDVRPPHRRRRAGRRRFLGARGAGRAG